MKRKLLAALGIAMILSATIPVMPAMAAEQSFSGDESTFTGGDASFDVNSAITKSDGTIDGAKIYSVDVTWSMTPGTYHSSGDQYSWDPLSRRYSRKSKNTEMKKNSDAAVNITITNRSNDSVNYVITYSPETDGSNIISAETATGVTSGSLGSAAPSNPGLTGSPESGTTGTATTATYTASIGFNDNALSSEANAAKKMGAYKVTISRPTVSTGTTTTVNTTRSHGREHTG